VVPQAGKEGPHEKKGGNGGKKRLLTRSKNETNERRRVFCSKIWGKKKNKLSRQGMEKGESSRRTVRTTEERDTGRIGLGGQGFETYDPRKEEFQKGGRGKGNLEIGDGK